jgi:hypothetical protein
MAPLRRLLAILVGLVLTGLAPAARGAPMATDLATLRAQTKLVVLGTVHLAAGPGNTTLVTLDVDKVVLGSAPLGRMSVKESPDGHVTVDNERVVAFVDHGGALRWVGRLAAGPSLERGVIRLQGFFDFNAHIVRPGIVTLPELRSVLATGRLDQTFDATLAFRDGHGGFARSRRTLTVRYEPLTRALHVLGATPVCLAPAALFGLEWGSFELRFNDTCPSRAPNAPSRDLELDGKFTGVDAATGHIQVQLVPTRPMLTEREYAAFATDGAIADVWSVVRVALSDGTRWTWRVEHDLIDAHGKAHAAGGVSTSSRTAGGKTVTNDVYGFAGGVKIALSPSASAASPGGNAEGILTLVDSGRITSCTFSQTGHPDRACTLTVGAPRVLRR